MASTKRQRDESFDGIGPPPPAMKKAKKLKFANIYLDLLPNARMYEKSYMHRANVTQTISANKTNFVITAGEDGFVKFWKKQAEGIVFVKMFRAHLGPVTCMAATNDGLLLATISEQDKELKIFEIVNFGLFLCIFVLKMNLIC